MSGICGQFNFNDAPVSDAELRAMSAMLEKRGPDASRLWRGGQVGLGHTLLATTPELESEIQPFVHAETGCVITADVRLDYRNELIDALGRAENQTPAGDAELILLAYLAWGEACVEQLLGDFAFAIWDPRHQKLFCARDHFGMRPFYYHHVTKRRFLFASDPKAILVLPDIPYQVDEGRIADYLVLQLEWIDYTSTFFAGVLRLAPGHRMTVTPAKVDIAEYWQAAPGPELGSLSDDDYEQGFLEVFTRAVEQRLRAPSRPVGSMFSGGMDSGSIVAVASDLSVESGDGPLQTYSAVRHRGDDCAESKAIYSALSMPSISPTLVHPDRLDEYYSQLVSSFDEPFDGQFTILKAVYLAAQANGQRVVLDGAGGDLVLGEGSYIKRLLRNGHIRLALAETIGRNRFWQAGSLASDLIRFTGAAFAPGFVKKIVRRRRKTRNIRECLDYSTISEEFANTVNILARFERMEEMFPGDWTPDYALERTMIIRPNVSAGRERYARLAAFAATEARDPFIDRRVVDYCSRLPGRIRMQNGWPKMILRKIMQDRLPDEVRWARGKPHLGSVFNAALTQHAIRNGELEKNRLQMELKGYVEPHKLEKAWREFLDASDTQNLHTAYVLSVWLRENEHRPVVST